jgi:DHA1 family multidrug resistance protein-like MFS transporter
VSAEHPGPHNANPTEANEWTAPSRRPSPFVLLCGVGFLGRLSYEMARTPLTPLYAQHLGAPVQLIGLIVAAVTITGIVVKLLAGALSDLFGFRRLMMAGALVKATGPFLYLLALSWPVLLAVRFYHGLATALYAPPASALVAKVYPYERGQRLGLYNAAENAGVVLGPMLGGVVLTLTVTNYSLSFSICGVIGVLALLVMTRIPRDEVTNAPVAPDSGQRRQLGPALRSLAVGVREIIADPAIRLISLIEAMLWVGIGSVQAYLPLYALTIHLPTWQIGLIAGAQGIASVISRPIMGQRSDRLSSRKPLIVAGSLLCIGTLVAIPYSAGFLVLLALSIVFGLGTGIVTPSTMAMIGDLVTKGNYGSAMGVFGSLWDAGHATGPIVFGFLLVALGYRTSWLIMALVMVIALLIFLFGTRRAHNPANA